MRTIEEVAIVGAGPSGAYCALKLAKEGIKPIILDHSHPREKPCGGGISPQLIQKIPFIEEFRSQGSTFGKFKIITCTNTQVTTNQLANGFSISRLLLDQKILNIAVENGAKLLKEKVIDAQKNGTTWKITTEKSIYSAKILVGADGVNSLVRRKTINPITNENLALTFGYLSTGINEDNALIKFLGEVPGYIWVFPGKDFANIGIGSNLKNGEILKKLLDTFISSNLPKAQIISRYAAILPSVSDPEFFKLPCASENWILIGDAAGHVDPISGGGIMYALWGGELAAQAIINDDPKSFDNMWRKAYGNTLERNCRKKSAFYDPLESTASILAGLANKTYLLT